MNSLDPNYSDTFAVDASNSTKQEPTVREEVNESLLTPVKRIDEPLTTPENNKIQSQTSEPQAQIQTLLSSHSEISYFDPDANSTPAKPNPNNSSVSSVHQSHQQEQQSCDSFNNTPLAVNESWANCTNSYLPNAHTFTPSNEKLPLFVPVMTLATNSNASSNNDALPHNSILISIPSDVTVTAPAIMPSTRLSSIQSNDISNHSRQQIISGPAYKKPGCRSKRLRFRSAAYSELENLDPNSIEPPVS